MIQTNKQEGVTHLVTEYDGAVLEQLTRIADAQEKLAAANAEFQRAIIAAFTPLMPAMLAMFSKSFIPPIMTLPAEPPKVNNG